MSDDRIAAICALYSVCSQPNPPRQSFPDLLRAFEPAITNISSSYPPHWRDDLKTEGRIAVWLALIGYADTSRPEGFVRYALRSIKSRMLNFQRTFIKRSDIMLVPIAPLFENETIEEYASDKGSCATSVLLSIDFEHFTKKEDLLPLGLTPREADAFLLHDMEGCRTCETASMLKISKARASTLITSAHDKLAQFLSN